MIAFNCASSSGPAGASTMISSAMISSVISSSGAGASATSTASAAASTASPSTSFTSNSSNAFLPPDSRLPTPIFRLVVFLFDRGHRRLARQRIVKAARLLEPDIAEQVRLCQRDGLHFHQLQNREEQHDHSAPAFLLFEEIHGGNGVVLPRRFEYRFHVPDHIAHRYVLFVDFVG